MAKITIERSELEAILHQVEVLEDRVVRLLDQNPKQKRGTPKNTVSVADWTPSDDTIGWITGRWGPIDYSDALQDFKEFFAANPPKSPGMWDAMLKKNPVFAGKLSRKQFTKAKDSFDVKSRAREIYHELKSGQFNISPDEYIGNDRIVINWLLDNSFIEIRNGYVVVK